MQEEQKVTKYYIVKSLDGDTIFKLVKDQKNVKTKEDILKQKIQKICL